MGTGFTIDTPLRVARYGIDSVISLVDDVLIEQIRRYHARAHGMTAQPVRHTDPDMRAARITRYLDLLNELIAAQVATRSPEDRARARALLPAGSDSTDRVGAIDVNIMTKVDRALTRRGLPRPQAHSDALSALRGFAQSTVQSAVVLSAGLNRELYAYLGHFEAFRPDADGQLRKRIILKVSDYRSAAVQGKLLARQGLWVSEFRVESGLNCGGHAFGGSGQLLGPILAAFRAQREALRAELGRHWGEALARAGYAVPPIPPQRITAQGGIGTASEHAFLLQEFGLESVGWGTPFLLVPEVVAIDNATLAALASAGAKDVQLREVSPLGLPFYVLRTSASEHQRRERIARGRPGSPCRKGYLADNHEFGPVPLCVASHEYQSRKLAQIDAAGLDPHARDAARAAVLEKACICHDLGGGATTRYGLDTQATPLVCPGPNIVNFSRVSTLDEMVDHIYGRRTLPMPADRPHMFIREFELVLEYLGRIGGPAALHTSDHPARPGLLHGIATYLDLLPRLPANEQAALASGLQRLARQLGLATPEEAGSPA